MIKSMIFAAMAAVTSTAALADPIFDRSLTTWTKVQDASETGVTWWSLVGSDGVGLFRIDLVHMTQKVPHPTFYYVRRPCANGNLNRQRILPGNQLGLGLDCTGNIPAHSLLATKAKYIAELPREAQQLLE